MKVFLDTNIIIDFYAERQDHFQAASVIMDLAVKKEIEIVVSAITFVNAFFLLKSYYRPSELYDPMKRLADLCIISPVDKEIVYRSLEMQSPDFEDAVQMQSSITEEVDVVVTRDRHFKYFEGNILSPTEFLNDYFENKVGIK